ncbi:nucleotide exchange factor GrpE [Micromonospora sp. CPCC 206060]|uniref:nucleotide exchange factor GrpE n=1 Tax=Micromonospora sp. CPCC 206060 TaxID=3122406 RepID=UPI002FF04422
MTDKPGATDPGVKTTGPAADGSAPDGEAGPRVVIRNNRKITDSVPVDGDSAGTPVDGTIGSDAEPATEGLVEEVEVVVDEVVETEPAPTGPPVVDAPAEPAEGGPAGSGALGAELVALRSELDERTRDLQRITAEYANYRKRVDRDRAVAAEQTTGQVLSALLPILDDLDRAREHGDLVGPFGTVAEQLTSALGKFGLTVFGEQGDPFDPTRHEAVAHQTSAEVTEPTCVQVMRRGYSLGDRLLRPAMVAVADPE